VNHFGPIIAAELRKRRARPHSVWHLDEVYLKIDGRMVYLWRAVDAEGEVLDVLVQSKRNKHAALKVRRRPGLGLVRLGACCRGRSLAKRRLRALRERARRARRVGLPNVAQGRRAAAIEPGGARFRSPRRTPEMGNVRRELRRLRARLRRLFLSRLLFRRQSNGPAGGLPVALPQRDGRALLVSVRRRN
jgi:hypothetical protein